jgi:uncharacterized protein YdeI (YjbR/CyaY-like superfamily)
MNLKVDFYFNKAGRWQAEVGKLRDIVLETGVAEVLRWGCPCYQHEERNIVLIHDFKDYCALLFFKGALMADPNNRLIQQTENVQSARQMRFTSLGEIAKLQNVIKAYIYEAIEIEKSGMKVTLKKTDEYQVPEELQNKLDEMPALEKAFKALTPGRQRAYIFHISQAKQAKTRMASVEKYVPQILGGKGIDD